VRLDNVDPVVTSPVQTNVIKKEVVPKVKDTGAKKLNRTNESLGLLTNLSSQGSVDLKPKKSSNSLIKKHDEMSESLDSSSSDES
jgi:hypothetical protein